MADGALGPIPRPTWKRRWPVKKESHVSMDGARQHMGHCYDCMSVEEAIGHMARTKPWTFVRKVEEV